MKKISLDLTLPNILTLTRIALIPFFVYLLADPTALKITIAFYIFIIAALTDYLDGFIARRFGYVSDFGKILDPLADKILVLAALIMLVSLRDLSGNSWVPGWMVVLVFARELWVTGLRGVALDEGNVIAAQGAGKVKSLLQMFSICALLLHDTILCNFPFPMTGHLVGICLLTLSLVFSYVGAVQYSLMVFGSK